MCMLIYMQGFPDSSVGEESAGNARDPGPIPGLGRSAREGIGYPLQYSRASLGAQLVKNMPAMRETWVPSLGWEDPLEKGKATHCSVGPGEFHGQYSPWGCKESDATCKLNLHVRETGLKLVYSDPQAGTEDSAPVLPSSMLVMIPFSFVSCVSFNRKKRLAQLYQQTTCFSLLWQIYSLNFFFHYKYYCHLAALMQVNTALETQDDFQVGYFYSCFLYI